MKKHSAFLLMAAASVLFSSAAFAASFDCTLAKTWTEKTVCNSRQLSNLDDLLGTSFKKALATSSNKAALKSEQQDWLKNTRDECTDESCLKTAYTQRIAELNDAVASAESPAPTASNSSSGDWYKAVAQPSLVVRNKPDVTGAKLGNVPYGGKVKLLSQDHADSISGHAGHWVQIEWQGKTGFVFDAFLESLGTTTNNPKPIANNTPKSNPTPNTSNITSTLTGVITSYDCGDNCYLTVKDSKGEEHVGLCSAPLCESWNEVTSMPNSYKNRKVKIGVGTGTQYDGGGNVMGEMDAFESITLLN